MKIVDVKTTLISIPHLGGYQDATMRHPQQGHSVLFTHIETDEGIEGLGPGRGGIPARAIIEKDLKSLLIGRDPVCIERIWDDMFWRLRGIGRKGLAFCALSAVDIALWDLKAKTFDVPLFRLLGHYTDRVPVYGSGGWTNLSLDELVAEQTSYVKRGITAVKLKVGKDFGTSEREDIDRVAAVRQAVGEDVEILVDANGGYYTKQAIRMAKEFQRYRIGWFEEPVMADDIPGLASVVKAIEIPVATGEHEYTKYGFRALIEGGGADIVQPNAARMGGVTEWLKVVHLAQAFNLPVAPHATQLVHLHLACATPNLLTVEYLAGHEEADEIIYTECPRPKDGLWAPHPEKPGLGLDLDPNSLAKYSV